MLLSACGASMPLSVDGGNDAGVDAGTMDPFTRTWQLSGSVGAHQFYFPLELALASDGNYRGRSAGCTLPLEKINSTTLHAVQTTCTFTQQDLLQTRLNGLVPAFGDPVSMTFVGGGEVRLVAGVLTANGTVLDTRFPAAPLSYSFSTQ